MISGVGTTYQLIANAAFVTAVPDRLRARAFGLVRSGLLAVQGGAFLLAGALALRVSPGAVIAGAGAAGLAAGVLALAASRPADGPGMSTPGLLGRAPD